MTMLAAAEVAVAPILALSAVLIGALHVHGWIDDELLVELQKPFSSPTLLLVATVTVLVGQLCWLASN